MDQNPPKMFQNQFELTQCEMNLIKNRLKSGQFNEKLMEINPILISDFNQILILTIKSKSLLYFSIINLICLNNS